MATRPESPLEAEVVVLGAVTDGEDLTLHRGSLVPLSVLTESKKSTGAVQIRGELVALTLAHPVVVGTLGGIRRHVDLFLADDFHDGIGVTIRPAKLGHTHAHLRFRRTLGGVRGEGVVQRAVRVVHV